MSPTVVIRPARSADADALGVVHVAAWRWAYQGLVADAYLESLDPDRRAAMWRNVLDDPDRSPPIVAVDDDDRIVGFVHQGPSRDEDARTGVGEVTALYLAPEHVGTGIGSALWATTLDELRRSGHSSVTVWVLRTNERGRRFYDRVGLRPDGATQVHTRGDIVLDEVRYRGPIDPVR